MLSFYAVFLRYLPIKFHQKKEVGITLAFLMGAEKMLKRIVVQSESAEMPYFPSFFTLKIAF